MARIECRCGCRSTAHDAAHPIVAALADDDIDRALEAGLLTLDPCAACSPACTAMLLAARGTRLTALAARERFRARAARLLLRQQERNLRRLSASSMTAALPPAAAAALSRAKARAAGHE